MKPERRAGIEFERIGDVDARDLANMTLVFDRTPIARLISCAAVFASGALFFDYLSRGPENLRFFPFLGFSVLFVATIITALVQYGDRIYVAPEGVLFQNRLLSLLGRRPGWLPWKDVVEVREVRRKILVLLSQDGRRLMVDAITGYAIARTEILRRAPHAVISGTLTRDDRP
jgi:hypothetical protein